MKEKKKIDWYELMCAFFAEELKENKRLATIIQTNYLIEVKSDVRNLQQSVFNSIQELREYYVFSTSKIKQTHEVISTLKKDIVDEIKSEGERTRDLIEEFRKELRFELEQQRKNISNPHAKYVGNLIDFFSDTPTDGRLDIEIAVKSDMNIYLFHSYPLTVKLERVEFFVEESRLVFLSMDYARRDIGLPISQNVAEYLIKAREIILVHLVLPSMEVKGMKTMPLKVY